MILHNAKCNEDIIIVGLLRDTLEDTAITEEEIRNQFRGESSKARSGGFRAG
ncbi:hypothetical protein D3C74_207780 [compost metagenome]